VNSLLTLLSNLFHKNGDDSQQLARIQQNSHHRFKACKKDSLYAERKDLGNKNRRHSSSPLPGGEASFIIPPKVVSLPRVSAVSICAYFQALTECELGSKSGDSFRKTLRNIVRKVQKDIQSLLRSQDHPC
jgi:hypothetical protein